MARVTRFVIQRVVRLHEFLIQHCLKIFVACIVIALVTGTVQWISLYHPQIFVKLNENVREFPFGVTFGIFTVFLIATLLLYALHLESTQKAHFRSRNAIRSRYVDFIVLCLCTQMNDATERYLGKGVGTLDELDALQAEIEEYIERFRLSAQKLLNVPRNASLQELEDYFQLSQPGSTLGEEILKLKKTAEPLLTERAIKELLSK